VKYRDEFGFWFSANAGGYAGNMIALQFVEDALEVTNLSSTNGGNIRCEVKK
jgi:hypothetical protein